MNEKVIDIFASLKIDKFILSVKLVLLVYQY